LKKTKEKDGREAAPRLVISSLHRFKGS